MSTTFHLHGMVSVRVVGDERDVAVVARQIGPLVGPDVDDPDITIEFVDDLPLGPLTLLGRDELAADDDGLVVLRGRHKSDVRVRLPIEHAGGPCTIVCRRGLGAVPYLVAFVNLAVLARGGVALHAAAIEHRGVGLVVTGWSKGGKTESLLAALGAGSRYVGDEWVYLTPDGNVSGVPEPVRIWDWYLRQLRTSSATVAFQPAWTDVARLAALRYGSAAAAGLANARAGTSIAKQATRVRHLLDGQRHVDVPVHRLLGGPAEVRGTRLDAVVHVVSADDPETVVVAADGADVARRMSASLAYERLPLMAVYHAARYAFPDRRNHVLESATEVERERLVELFAGVPTFEIRHPYPPRLESIRAALDEVADTLVAVRTS